MYIAWNIFIVNCGNWPVHSRCTALKEGLYRLYGFLESAWSSLVSKKSWWKTLNFLRQCFQISRGQIWGWVSLILSEVIIPSYYCLFFFFLPIITYFSFFHTHLSDIPYEFNCDFLDSHSTMTICSLTWIYTALSVIRKSVRFLRINICILKT